MSRWGTVQENRKNPTQGGGGRKKSVSTKKKRKRGDVPLSLRAGKGRGVTREKEESSTVQRIFNLFSLEQKSTLFAIQ